MQSPQILAPHRQNPLIVAVLPVGDAAARGAPERRAGGQVLNPESFSGGRIERLHESDAIRRIENAADHQRRRAQVVAELEIGIWSSKLAGNRRPAPGDPEFPNIVPVDLVERGVLRISAVSPVEGPFTILLRACLGGDLWDRRGERSRNKTNVDPLPRLGWHGALQG